jgi:hypothetical protein
MYFDATKPLVYVEYMVLGGRNHLNQEVSITSAVLSRPPDVRDYVSQPCQERFLRRFNTLTANGFFKIFHPVPYILNKYAWSLFLSIKSYIEKRPSTHIQPSYQVMDDLLLMLSHVFSYAGMAVGGNNS